MALFPVKQDASLLSFLIRPLLQYSVSLHTWTHQAHQPLLDASTSHTLKSKFAHVTTSVTVRAVEKEEPGIVVIFSSARGSASFFAIKPSPASSACGTVFMCVMFYVLSLPSPPDPIPTLHSLHSLSCICFPT
ncbi:uncharacterized protein MONOS_14838 [Monocercomonoides exilis]|uniref:uncharacterized protein n=1 Tax=Monocercomonoides exilis TaxID=2049356 RepID=UPI00355A2C98|nr:hypothetical protein MONOS_14838 [Monocercomonoides exilis]|eukprot:MONOS_14838.1-p1 / transcript=MONOS_14838.1 / gene=MONOS_14838 / organism=Monocercomonoides_exilis_PA203 / gene_product=unspecified product / transcript_product=unspecified product / location=Mono_scaffold01083:6560-6958(+) / protein_length=133 / sequence_SO=supercontig / SO=protein_coding / is_pseudo=false